MKILAIEKDGSVPFTDEAKALLQAEAARAWELYSQGIVREIYFRADRTQAVAVLECRDREEAERILQSFPLAEKGYIAFDVIPLVPYPGFTRLFAGDSEK